MRSLTKMMSFADILVRWGAWSLDPCDAVCPGGHHSEWPGGGLLVVAFRPGLFVLVTISNSALPRYTIYITLAKLRRSCEEACGAVR